MQFIQQGKDYINVNRIVRIEAEQQGYAVIWLDELNKPKTLRVRKEEAEALQYLLAKK